MHTSVLACRYTEDTPWLQGLKQQLRALEWLMERHFPALAAHLQVMAHALKPLWLPKTVESQCGLLAILMQSTELPGCTATGT